MAEEPHQQVQALLSRIDGQPVPPTHALSVPEARERFADLFASMDAPDVARTREFAIEGPGGDVPLRLYLPEGERPHPVLVTFHGGGYVLGDLDTHDPFCRTMTNAAECAVLSVDYRLAPEHPFPAGVKDAYRAVEWVAERGDGAHLDPDRIAVGGDSAGGNLSAAVTLMARDRGGPDIDHQLLVYPAVHSPVLGTPESYTENAEGYFLELDSMQWFTEKYVQDRIHLRNAYNAPLLARDLSDLPPATVITAGFDPLRDEGQEYADRLASDGVPVEQVHYDDMIHGFVSMLGVVDAASEAVDVMAQHLREAFEE